MASFCSRISLVHCGRHGLIRGIRRCTTFKSRSKFKHTSVQFTDERVRSILGKLTGLDLDIIFKVRKETLFVPKYQLMNDEELKKANEELLIKANEVLEMPPVLEAREPIDKVIAVDDKLKDYDSHRHVFVDISMSATDKDPYIAVREVDGTLREATWDERDRMNQIYYPKSGRKLDMPLMLTGEYLPKVLRNKRHVDVLDLCNAQCEPDSPQYIDIHHFVYDDIIKNGLYELLHSTRHFGGLIWYMVRTDQVRGFVEDLLIREKRDSIIALADLYHLAYPDRANSGHLDNSCSNQAKVKNFFEQIGLQDSLFLNSSTDVLS